MSASSLFDTWGELLRVVVVSILAYTSLVAMLRVSGKRTLSKMNAFDLVVTVALGSTLSSIILSKDVALAEGVTALALLILLQFVVTWSSVRVSAIGRLVKSEPSLLYHRGEFLRQRMRRERVLESEILAATREQGHGSLDHIESVVLETDGTLSIVTSGMTEDSIRAGFPGTSQIRPEGNDSLPAHGQRE